MNTRLKQLCAEGKMSLEDCIGIKSLTILSNLIMVLVAGVVGMLISCGWILFT